MKRWKKFIASMWVFVAVGLMPSACIDTLDFGTVTDEGQLVIYGLLTDELGVHRVDVGRTDLFGLLPRGVTDATVILLEENGDFHLYRHTEEGRYELYDFQAEDGVKYAIQVTSGEQVYQSEFQELPKQSAEQSVDYSFFTESEGLRTRPFLSVDATVTLPESDEDVYLRWALEETFLWVRLWTGGPFTPPPSNCFIYDDIDPSTLPLLTSAGTGSRNFSLNLGSRLVDDSFLYPFFVTVRQLSVSRETFEYWDRVKQVLNNQGSLFDTPPAPIQGNIRNTSDTDERVLGYFEVAKVSISRVFTTSSDVPFFIPNPCEGAGNPPALCFECEAKAMGRRWTTVAPEWWNFN
jgi:hypothetical protein